MPTYHAHGSFHFNDIKLRFLVLDRWMWHLWAQTRNSDSLPCRFGSDLEKVFKGGEEPFPLATVFNIGYQVSCSRVLTKAFQLYVIFDPHCRC